MQGRHLHRGSGALLAATLAGCYTAPALDEAPPPGVVFTYPADGQRDVPLGARLLISFSSPIAQHAPDPCRVLGPAGAIAIATRVVGGGKTLAITSSELQPATTYEVQCALGTPELSEREPLLRFTTRNDRPLSGPPVLIAFNGSDPQEPGTFRPILTTSTLQLVFSEPLDPRSFASAASALELVDATTGAVVPATVLAEGIHVALDPVEPLIAGAAYVLRLDAGLRDLGGEHLRTTAVTFTPVDGIGAAAIRQTFRTWQAGDPNEAIARTDAMNVMEVAHPLIGETIGAMQPSVLETELGDPRALGGPIAFQIPRGQRLTSTGLDIRLAGAIPSGLATGEIWIELVTDGAGRLYRNPYRPADTIPDNAHAPLQVDLSLDLAVYARDATGNAVLAQTVLGAQLTGLAYADAGALVIETVGALDIGLLGISSAPANIVLDLISAPGATPAADVQSPALATSLPAVGTRDWAVDDGLELVFDEPIDIDRARAGGITLHDATDRPVPAALELHGSVVVLRPHAPLVGGRAYRIALTDVADRAGNVMPPATLAIGTQAIVQTAVPPSVVAVYPGSPCALVDGDAATAGRCAGGRASDDRYRPFVLAGNERVAVVFDQALRSSSLARGTTCNTGSVRIEQLDDHGACIAAVPGTLLARSSEIAFVPDQPWQAGARYRLRLVSGPNGSCDAGEICGANGRPASFDPLAGTTAAASGGPDLVIAFVGAPATSATTLLANASPETNRVALAIVGTSGLIQQASFQGPDCLPQTPAVEACMYVRGAIPAQLGARRDDCVLPDGTSVASCVPVTMSPQAMYSTPVAMTAGALGIGLPTQTGTSVMRVRERPDGAPLEGYIVERDGRPVMVVGLELYMDAPDMSLPFTQHDMHSKPLAVALEGPLEFRPDGRFAISLRNTAEVPISIGIDAPLGITGAVELVVPAGEMRLELMSPPQRGSVP